MRKIIKGKLYDTDTANMIGENSNGCYRSDAHYCSEKLYQKRTGEFFLYGEGGAYSQYGESYGDGSYGFGKCIIPMNEKDAREWMETYGDADKYIAVFGEVEE